jgi:hypothetical protein
MKDYTKKTTLEQRFDNKFKQLFDEKTRKLLLQFIYSEIANREI